MKHVEDSGYVLLTRYLGHYHLDNRIHLTKFDYTGQIQWQHVYAQSDTLIFAEEGLNLTILNANRYLISGWCYYPDPGETGGWKRPFLILTDSLGNDVWELPVVFDGYYHGYALSSILHKNYIYTCGQHIATSGGYPCIVKTTLDGDEIYTSDILTQGIYIGALGTIDPVNDSMLYVTGAWSSQPGSDETYTAFMKIDTLGNLIDSIIYMKLSNNIKWTTKTFDGKFVSVGTHYDGNWDMYAFKINENIEYDSIYTQPFTYDSLCPDIVSETFDLECDILVDLEELFTTAEGSHLKIYPNPANGKITVELPEYTVSRQQTRSFEISKVHYGLQEPAELLVYDIFGRKVKYLHLSKNQTQTEIDVSHWKSGIYLIELRSEGKVLDKGKFVVN
ncbi:MAG: T9SS type A sorting domain-containing protein [Bacteroidota bacterium]|nr:T9SS type A sorting domain-containing protein [Bacteroidota bacterium]